MNPSKRPLIALGVGLSAVAALVFASSELFGLSRERSPQTAPKVSQRQAREAKSGCCRSGETNAGQCCCGQPGPCRCGESLVLARAEAQEQQEKKKMMAGPEAKAKGQTARKAALEHQKALMKDHVYSCCIKPGCTFCSLSADMCPCAMNLKKGGPVCPECWGGWKAGKGRLSGVRTEDVKVIPESKLKMMYKMRAMNLEKAQGGE